MPRGLEIDDSLLESDENKENVSSLIDHKAVERVWSIRVVDAHLAEKIGGGTYCTIGQNLESDSMLVQDDNEIDMKKNYCEA